MGHLKKLLLLLDYHTQQPTNENDHSKTLYIGIRTMYHWRLEEGLHVK